ncbi:MAG: 4-hydroxy-tetrahydrodipicolinate synthase [Alphaproteobacteria bacterium]
MAKNATFSGCYTALATPFRGARVDHASFERFVEWQVGEGVHGLVPCGTTGESPTLTHDEHKDLIRRTVKVARGRAVVMAGTGSNSTAEAIALTRDAEKAGADAALVVAPYYNKPTQEGLFQHFRAVAKASGLPIFIYNIPGRSVVNLTDETLARLAEIPNIAGVKDATGDLARAATLRALIGERLVLFSGEDMTMVGFNAMGGRGVISVLSNLAPKAVAKVQELTLAGKYDEARKQLERFTALTQALFAETSPAPVKYALSRMGHGRAELRLPLVAPSSALQKRLKAHLKDLGFI